ncbi:hypothetical protein Q7P37_002936 [Cladosporium fusiforme]
MSFFTPRNMALAVGGAGALVFMFPRSAKAVAPTSNVFETQAVQNVGSRYAAQGGSNTHMPAVATPLGNPENTISNQEHAKGVSTPTFEKSQADQKVGTPNSASAAFSKAHLGNEKGK